MGKGGKDLKDVEKAKEILQKGDWTLVVVKGGEVLYRSKEKGIRPMVEAILKWGAGLHQASLADRVIGKAAAMLAIQNGICQIYTDILSKAAKEILDQRGVAYTYERCVPYIKNRQKTDLCPIEKLSKDIQDPAVLLEEIQKFLKQKEESAHEIISR